MSIFTYEGSMGPMLPCLSLALRLICVSVPFMAIKGIGASLLQAMKKARIPMYFDLIWAIIRLILFALSAYGFLGIDPFQGIMLIMVTLNTVGGFIVMSLAILHMNRLIRSSQ